MLPERPAFADVFNAADAAPLFLRFLAELESTLHKGAVRHAVFRLGVRSRLYPPCHVFGKVSAAFVKTTSYEFLFEVPRSFAISWSC